MSDSGYFGQQHFLEHHFDNQQPEYNTIRADTTSTDSNNYSDAVKKYYANIIKDTNTTNINTAIQTHGLPLLTIGQKATFKLPQFDNVTLVEYYAGTFIFRDEEKQLWYSTFHNQTLQSVKPPGTGLPIIHYDITTTGDILYIDKGSENTKYHVYRCYVHSEEQQSTVIYTLPSSIFNYMTIKNMTTTSTKDGYRLCFTTPLQIGIVDIPQSGTTTPPINVFLQYKDNYEETDRTFGKENLPIERLKWIIDALEDAGATRVLTKARISPNGQDMMFICKIRNQYTYKDPTIPYNGPIAFNSNSTIPNYGIVKTEVDFLRVFTVPIFEGRYPVPSVPVPYPGATDFLYGDGQYESVLPRMNLEQYTEIGPSNGVNGTSGRSVPVLYIKYGCSGKSQCLVDVYNSGKTVLGDSSVDNILYYDKKEKSYSLQLSLAEMRRLCDIDDRYHIQLQNNGNIQLISSVNSTTPVVYQSMTSIDNSVTDLDKISSTTMIKSSVASPNGHYLILDDTLYVNPLMSTDCNNYYIDNITERAKCIITMKKLCAQVPGMTFCPCLQDADDILGTMFNMKLLTGDKTLYSELVSQAACLLDTCHDIISETVSDDSYNLDGTIVQSYLQTKYKCDATKLQICNNSFTLQNTTINGSFTDSCGPTSGNCGGTCPKNTECKDNKCVPKCETDAECQELDWSTCTEGLCTENTESTSSFPTWAIATIVGSSILVLVLITIVVLFIRRRKMYIRKV